MGNFAVEPVAQFTLKRALKPLAMLCGLVVAWGICKIIDRFVRAMFGTLTGVVGWIPFLGRVVAAPISQIEQRVTNAIGGWADGLERDIGSAFHQLAGMVRQLGVAIRNAHLILYDIAKLLSTFLDYRTYQHLVKDLRGYDRATISQAKTATKKASAAQAQAHAATVRAAHAQTLTGAREVEHVILKDVKALRARTKKLENEYTNLWKAFRAHPWTVASDAFVGAIAIALTSLGLGWLKCPAVGRLGNRIGCNGFLALDDLLFGAVTALAVVDICDFADAAYTLAEELSPLLIELVDVENALIGCHGATAPPLLGVAPRSLPAPSAPLELAA